jgi:membrane protein DedA with SNARE-associated domain
MDFAPVDMLLAFGLIEENVFELLKQAFYPALLLIFVIASLGVPIPEDLPLMAAGVILRTSPEIASWPLTILVSTIGIMSGDLILYSLGRVWGDDVFSHKSVRWLISPARLRLMKQKFLRHGTWMVFFGRFIVGVRAVMCLSAGVTRFPYWRFFLADFCGAMITIPMFIGLGYAFAYAFPTLKAYLGDLQLIALIVVLLAIGCAIWYRIHRRSKREIAAVEKETPEGSAAGTFRDAPDDAKLDTANPTPPIPPRSLAQATARLRKQPIACAPDATQRP